MAFVQCSPTQLLKLEVTPLFHPQHPINPQILLLTSAESLYTQLLHLRLHCTLWTKSTQPPALPTEMASSLPSTSLYHLALLPPSLFHFPWTGWTRGRMCNGTLCSHRNKETALYRHGMVSHIRELRKGTQNGHTIFYSCFKRVVSFPVCAQNAYGG